MLVYLFFIIITILFILFEKVQFIPPVYIRFFYFLILISFTGFRYQIGWDYNAYDEIIDNLRNSGLLTYDRGEFLSNILFKIVASMKSNYLFFFITSILMYGLILTTLNKYSSNYGISLIFFICFPLFFLNSLSIIRNFVAISICFWGYQFLRKNQIFKYVITILIATMFHKSALVAFFLIFLRKMIFSKKISLFLLFTAMVLQNLITKLSILEKIPTYGVYFVALQENQSTGGNKAILLLIILLLFFIFLKKKQIEKELNFYYNSVLIGVLFYITFLGFGTVAHRASLYFTIYILLALPEFLYSNRYGDLLKKYFLSIVLIASFFYIIIITLNSTEAPFLPYRTIFSKD